MKYVEVSRQWRRLLVVSTLAVVVLLGLLISLALAQTNLPPAGAQAFIQTSGPLTPLGVGDWYTNGTQGDAPHIFRIFVPCTIDPAANLTVDLFDPEIAFGTIAIDEIRQAGWTAPPLSTNIADADNAEFVLIAPDGTTEVQRTTYTPTGGTNDIWVPFVTFTTGIFGCGIYELQARTFDDPIIPFDTGANDDNSWRVRITHPDGTPGTGDEPAIAALNTSYQHAGLPDQVSCQDFYFFVLQTQTSITLNNFDLDEGGGFYMGQSLSYFQPDGTAFTDPGPPAIPSLSGGTVWNNSTTATRVGDVINNPQAGWWRAEICVAGENQYIFEPPGDFILSSPELPDPALSLAAPPTCREPGQSQTIPYTIPYGNDGADAEGAAFNPVLTVNLPASTSLVPGSCVGADVVSCVESPAGVVTINLGQVLAAGATGQVAMTLLLDAGAPPAPLLLSSTADFAYQDTFGNVYPPISATNELTISEPCPPPTPTPTSTPTPKPTRPGGGDRDRDPTSTPPPPPPAATPVAAAPPPAAELPVAFLPETGLRDAPWSNHGVIGMATLLLALSGTITMILVWRKRKK